MDVTLILNIAIAELVARAIWYIWDGFMYNQAMNSNNAIIKDGELITEIDKEDLEKIINTLQKSLKDKEKK